MNWVTKISQNAVDNDPSIQGYQELLLEAKRELHALQDSIGNGQTSPENLEELEKIRRKIEYIREKLLAITEEVENRVINQIPDGTPKSLYRAIEEFGLTDRIEEAGFILPDGSMLDFSGNSATGSRALDHREILATIDTPIADAKAQETGDPPGPTERMIEAITSTNIIRFSYFNRGQTLVHIYGKEPTPQQKNRILDAALQGDEFGVIVHNISGNITLFSDYIENISRSTVADFFNHALSTLSSV